MFGGGSSRDEEAAELFVKAGNSFKLAKAWKRTGDAFTRAAETYEGSSELGYEAAAKYSDAGKAYKNVNPDKAIDAYRNAVRMYTDAAQSTLIFDATIAAAYPRTLSGLVRIISGRQTVSLSQGHLAPAFCESYVSGA